MSGPPRTPAPAQGMVPIGGAWNMRQWNPAGVATSSGVEQKVQISGMPLLRKRDNAPGDRPTNMPQNGLPNLTSRYSRVVAGRMFDQLQMRLEMSQFIFIKDSGLNPGNINGAKSVYSLQLLNFNFEQSYLNGQVTEARLEQGRRWKLHPSDFGADGKAKRMEQLAAEELGSTDDGGLMRSSASALATIADKSKMSDADNYTSGSHKRKFAAAELRDQFPLDAAEFVKSINLLGVIFGFNEAQGMNNRDLSYVYHGRVSVPNIFSSTLKVGEKVGFIVKRFDQIGVAGFVNIDGVAIGASTVGSFLQIRGVAGHVPPFHAKQFAHPDDTNLDYWNPDAVIRTRSVGTERVTDPVTGEEYETLKWNNVKDGTGKMDRPTRLETYEEGYYIHVGTVMFISGNPSEQQRLMAHRSIPHYRELARNCLVTIALDQTAQDQITCIAKP